MYKSISPSGNISILESYRTGAKTSSRKVASLGNANTLKTENGWDDAQLNDWIKSQIESLEQEREDTSGSVTISFSKKKKIPFGQTLQTQVGYLFLQQVLYSLGFSKICSEITKQYRFTYDFESIFSYLIYARILYPGSKNMAFKKRDRFPEPLNFSLKNIYRALDVLGENSDKIQSSLYKASRNVVDRDASILIYDCSNFYFEVESADDFRKYGKSKENRPNPIVTMGLFTDREGIPFRMQIFPGNQNEQTTIDRSVIQSIRRDYDVKRFIYSADAGLGSNKIKKALDNPLIPCAYVVTQSIKKMEEDLAKWALGESDPEDDNWWFYQKYDPEQQKMVTYKILFKDINADDHYDTIFFRDKWVRKKNGKGKNNFKDERYVVTFSLKYRNYLQQLRNEHLNRALSSLMKNKGRKRQTDPQRLIKETRCTDDGEIAENKRYEIDEEKIIEEERFDGFYCIATDLEDEIGEILAINKNRWRIEAGFRVMKTHFDARPVYVRTEEHIKPHFLVCFVALLVFRILQKQLDYQYSEGELIQVLQDMMLLKLSDEGYTPGFKRNKLTDILCDTYSMPLEFEYISQKKLDQIIKKSKKPMRKKKN